MKNSNWNAHIDYLKTKTKNNVSKEELSNALKKCVTDSLPTGKFGILLSGGIDSTLIAKICKDFRTDFRCFCVGIKGSADIEGAKIAANKLNENLKSFNQFKTSRNELIIDGINGFEVEKKEFGNCFGTKEFIEGTTAFMEKRKAKF